MLRCTRTARNIQEDTCPTSNPRHEIIQLHLSLSVRLQTTSPACRAAAGGIFRSRDDRWAVVMRIACTPSPRYAGRRAVGICPVDPSVRQGQRSKSHFPYATARNALRLQGLLPIPDEMYRCRQRARLVGYVNAVYCWLVGCSDRTGRFEKLRKRRLIVCNTV